MTPREKKLVEAVREVLFHGYYVKYVKELKRAIEAYDDEPKEPPYDEYGDDGGKIKP